MRPGRVLERTTVTEAWVLTWAWTSPIDSWRHERSRMTIAMKGLILNTGAMDREAEVIEARKTCWEGRLLHPDAY